MSFASNAFVFLLFPVYVLAILLAHRGLRSPYLAFWVLFVISFVFYAVWSIHDLFLLLGSITVNFFLGLAIEASQGGRRKAWLYAGSAANLAFLGYFKYTGFLLSNLPALGFDEPIYSSIVLPLGISFYTLQKIAYLADIAEGQPAERSFIRFMLFVFFFPQLIAGPIVSMKELLPQISIKGLRKAGRLIPQLAPLGFVWFGVGLFKKTVLADNVALIADPLFAKAGLVAMSMPEAWLAAFAYGLQLYFDFSGYCDMAIGIALIAGIRLPLNFNAPYRANSIRDFWRRWHMTLTRLMTRFLYIPFGGNRHGIIVQVAAVMGTMLISGLWHGANWTFVIWGGYHGLMLAALVLWNQTRFAGVMPVAAGRVLTLLLVMLGWIFFRAETVTSAFSLYGAAFDVTSLADGLAAFTRKDWTSVGVVAMVLAATQLLPTMQEFSARSWQRQFVARLRRITGSAPFPARGLPVRSSYGWMLVTSGIFAICFWQLGTYSPFIYFQF